MQAAEKFIPIEPRSAPASTKGISAWVRSNLFSSVTNSILTVLLAALAIYSIFNILNWGVFQADFIGETRDDCRYEDGTAHPGACWVYVGAKLHQFLFGLYPSEEYWRVILSFLLFIGGIAWLVIERVPYKKYMAIFMLVGLPIVVYFLMAGGVFGLPEVESTQWGGLALTLIIAVVGMVGALPLGVLLALGRRSNMPIVRSVCVIFIEFWRGVPLITVLFMSSVMLPLFFPVEGGGDSIPKLLRALIGVMLFQSAYMAEVVRGGLQTIPKGQYEAADAMGLNYLKKTRLIILPQALKLVIPGIVNTFIALFKDTTLVLIIGMFDLLGAVDLTLKDPNWVGYSTEGYIFTASIFWMFCFAMSRYSHSLEIKLDTGHRN